MAFLYVDGRRYYNYTESGAKETAMTGEDGLLQMTFDKDGVYEVYFTARVYIGGSSFPQHTESRGAFDGNGSARKRNAGHSALQRSKR